MNGINQKSGNPTQPGNRSNASRPRRNRKQKNIIHQIVKFYKRFTMESRALLILLPLCAVALIIGHFDTEKKSEYIFTDDAGTPVKWQEMTTAWASEACYEKRYDITDSERWTLASVVTAEAEGEPFAGKVAVAQCILQACEDDGIRPGEALTKYEYSKNRPEPCDEALEAVQAVFDHGDRATAEPIKYFYAPARTESDWHESQTYVMSINNHKFFKEKGAQTNGKSN
jgi:spore germination cell wall hydrolase CwlJ-like protein